MTRAERGQFLLDYIELLRHERVRDERSSHERWIVNKIRALGSWYTKGFEGGSVLRTGLNSADSLEHVRAIIHEGFFSPAPAGQLLDAAAL